MASSPALLPPAATLAYPSPWRLDRTLPPPWYRLEHRGFEAAHAVSITLQGSSRLICVVPDRVGPGELIRFAVRGADPAIDSTLLVRWLRPEGEEYLWRSVF